MALITTWLAAGDGFLVRNDVSQRKYDIENDQGAIITLNETTTIEEREWIGLSLSAVNQAIDENLQPAENDSSYSYSATRDRIEIGSYKLRRVYEKKVTV